jgi:hypothetical protein
MAKSFHEKADPSQAGIVVSVEWSSMELIRLCRHPSIRTLYERWFARCQLGVLNSAGAATCESTSAPIVSTEVGPGLGRSHPNSAVEFGSSHPILCHGAYPITVPFFFISRSPFRCVLNAPIVGSVSHPVRDRPPLPISGCGNQQFVLSDGYMSIFNSIVIYVMDTQARALVLVAFDAERALSKILNNVSSNGLLPKE